LKHALLTLTLAALATGCNGLPGGAPTPSPSPASSLATEDDKTLYALGMVVGTRVASLKLQPADMEKVSKGFNDGALGKTAQVDMNKYGPLIEQLARTRAGANAQVEKDKAKAYLETAAKEPGAVATPSGLVFKSLQPGSGPKPQPTSTVSVNYEGKLTDGTVFDASAKHGGPAEFPLNGVIPCWTEGLQRMSVGEKARLVCPSSIAYGDPGRPPTIPGGATLVFEVELLSIKGS
jgi:FKBP-type peptidyl-prolyl cis-trans isomerase FkpA